MACKAQKEEAKKRHETAAAEEKKNAIVEWLDLLASQVPTSSLRLIASRELTMQSYDDLAGLQRRGESGGPGAKASGHQG